MRVAVLSLTRDRLDYTKRSFAQLAANAGCDFDHYVLDQASEDGTRNWLDRNIHVDKLHLASKNLGICPALNLLLEEYLHPADYDVIVRFDNDCEVTEPGTLEAVCRVVCEHEDVILAPRVLGLRNPPMCPGVFYLGDHAVDETHLLGGVFMAIPSKVFLDGFRFDESSPPWGGDEYVTSWLRSRGGRCGYLRPWAVWHRTDQHLADFDWYYERRAAEGGPRQ